jgi:glycosyltransferase involved in cell wall biosynthesis
VGEPGVPEFRRATLRAIEESGLSDEVILTGYVADEDLPTYYSGAECFVLPSLYEGFGLPPLEAMACGCPVIVSNVTSLPEIVGDAALLVNPHSADELARAIESILTNGRLKEGLVTRGLKHAGKFSWEKTATETEKVYEAVECSIGHDYVPTAN